jgi:hypothetical protein
MAPPTLSASATRGSAASGESSPAPGSSVAGDKDRPQVGLVVHRAAHHDVDDVVDFAGRAKTARISQPTSMIVTIEDHQADFAPAGVIWPPRPRHAETVRRGGGSKSFSLYEIDSERVSERSSSRKPTPGRKVGTSGPEQCGWRRRVLDAWPGTSST